MAEEVLTSLGWVALASYCLLAARANTRFALGSDLGLWLLWPATEAVPYRDFTDCKPPGVYALAYGCYRLGGRTVEGARAVFEAVCALVVLHVGLTAGVFAGAVLALFLFSTHLEAADAWVERASTCFFTLAVVTASPGFAALAALLAVATNLKLGPPLVVFVLASESWELAASAALMAGVLAAVMLSTARGRALLAELAHVPIEMLRRRYTAGIASLASMWSGRAALLGGPPLLLVTLDTGLAPVTLAAAAYVLVNSVGRVWWPYHWIPFGVLCAGAVGPWAAGMLLVDALASAGFPRDMQARLWGSRAKLAEAARELGLRVRDQEGSLWVDHEATQIYVYAQKRPAGDGVAQYEVAAVRDPVPASPDLVVVGPGSTWSRRGYRWVDSVPPFSLLARSSHGRQGRPR